MLDPAPEAQHLEWWRGGVAASLDAHQCKLMGDPAVRGKLGTEAQRREHLVAVVVLDDVTHGLQRHGVGVQLIRAHVVEGGGLGRVTCVRWTELDFRTCVHGEGF